MSETLCAYACMAAALKEHWGPLSTRDNPTPAVISDYLSCYNKRLDPIPTVSLETVLTVLAERRDSSTSPDFCVSPPRRHLHHPNPTRSAS